MTYTETQLEAIKLFGRKDLEIGCKIFFKDSKQPFTYAGEIGVFVGNPDFEILGHEPHLEDLFRLAEEKASIDIIVGNGFLSIVDYVTDEVKVKIPYNPSIPLLDQPNLSDIISLFR